MCLVTSLLCLYVHVHVGAAGTDTQLICKRGSTFLGGFLYRGLFVLGGFLYRGHFVSGGFCPRWLFDWGAFCPVAFVRGLFAGGFLPGAFVLEPITIYI